MLAPSAAGKLSRILTLDYSREEGRRDLIAGLTVAAIALPEGMAYAVIAGVDPRFGLYSSIVLTAVAAIFGSSSHLITGATSAVSLVVFSVLAFFDPDDSIEAVEALFLLGVMVGAIQIFVAVFRLGDLTRYISESVILGFMVGAAIVLAISQVANFLGVHVRGTGHQNILHRLLLTLTEGYPFNLKAIATSTATVALVLILRKVVRAYRLPHVEMLAVLVLVTAAAFSVGWSQPDAGGKTAIAGAGAVPASLPSPHIPEIKFAWVSDFASTLSPSPCWACSRPWPPPSPSPANRVSDSTIIAYAFRKDSPIWLADSSAVCRAPARCPVRRSISRPGRRRGCRASSPP